MVHQLAVWSTSCVGGEVVDNAIDIIFLAIALLLTIILCTYSLQLVKTFTFTDRKVTSDLTVAVNSANSSIYMGIEGESKSGTEVAAAIQQFYKSIDIKVYGYSKTGQYDNFKFAILGLNLTNSAGDATHAIGETFDSSRLYTPGDTFYINTGNVYDAMLDYDADGVVVGITYVQVNKEGVTITNGHENVSDYVNNSIFKTKVYSTAELLQAYKQAMQVHDTTFYTTLDLNGVISDFTGADNVIKLLQTQASDASYYVSVSNGNNSSVYLKVTQCSNTNDTAFVNYMQAYVLTENGITYNALITGDKLIEVAINYANNSNYSLVVSNSGSMNTFNKNNKYSGDSSIDPSGIYKIAKSSIGGTVCYNATNTGWYTNCSLSANTMRALYETYRTRLNGSIQQLTIDNYVYSADDTRSYSLKSIEADPANGILYRITVQ